MLKKLNTILVKGVVFFIRLYQLFISPLFPNTCKYYPSCSTYSLQAVKKYGLIKGILKSIYRILRCNPFSHGGYDPI